MYRETQWKKGERLVDETSEIPVTLKCYHEVFLSVRSCWLSCDTASVLSKAATRPMHACMSMRTVRVKYTDILIGIYTDVFKYTNTFIGIFVNRTIYRY